MIIIIVIITSTVTIVSITTSIIMTIITTILVPRSLLIVQVCHGSSFIRCRSLVLLLANWPRAPVPAQGASRRRGRRLRRSAPAAGFLRRKAARSTVLCCSCCARSRQAAFCLVRVELAWSRFVLNSCGDY